MNNPNVEALLKDLSSAILNLNSKFDATSARYETVIQELRSENQRLSNEMTRIQDILKTIQGAATIKTVEIDSTVTRAQGTNASKYATKPAAATPIAVPRNDTNVPAVTTPRSSAKPTGKQADSWVQVAKRKPKAPLSDRKRLATARAFFAPPDVAAPSGYAYVYIPRSRNLNRRDVRHRFSLLGIETARVIDISFPARSVIGILLHKEYLATFTEILSESKVKFIEDFIPTDATHIADPKYADMPAPQRSRLAVALQQDRCYNTLNFVREYLVPSVSKFFVEKGWINDALARSVIQQRLPRPTKKAREDSYRGSAADAFLNTTYDSDAEMGEEFHENAYGTDTDSGEEVPDTPDQPQTELSSHQRNSQ